MKRSVRRLSWARTFAVGLACCSMIACTTTGPEDRASPAAQRAKIETNVDATLSRLYQASPDSRELARRAAGVLVFPSVLSVSLGIGGEHGDGVLRVGGTTVDDYSLSAGSIGLQAGAQSKAVILLFMTSDSLSRFRNSRGWTAGVDATVAVADIGASGSIDTATAQQPVIGFVLSNAGLMAGVSLQGTKISKR